MQRNVIIVGGGRVGRHVADRLGDGLNRVTVVERDPEKCEQVSRTVTGVIEGDGTDPDVMAGVDFEAADVVAALTNDTDVNLTVCEMAYERSADVRTILRISRDGEQDYGHRGFVDDVVYPAAAGADVAFERITAQ